MITLKIQEVNSEELAKAVARELAESILFQSKFQVGDYSTSCIWITVDIKTVNLALLRQPTCNEPSYVVLLPLNSLNSSDVFETLTSRIRACYNEVLTKYRLLSSNY